MQRSLGRVLVKRLLSGESQVIMSAQLRKKAFSLVEVLTVVVIVAILVSLTAGVGKYIKTKANIKLAESQLEIIVTALEQYYDDYNDFPCEENPNNPPDTDNEYTQSDFVNNIQGTVTPSAIVPNEDWSSIGLYYFLNRSANSRKIIGSLANRFITNKTAAGAPLTADITIGGVTEKKDLVRFIDLWGTTLRYTYSAGDSFPVITSAGPDKQFGTGDDITSR